MVRTAGPPAAMIESVRREIWAVDRGIALGFTISLETWMKQIMYAEPRFGMVVITVFAGVGLVLVAIGVWSCEQTWHTPGISWITRGTRGRDSLKKTGWPIATNG